MRSEPAFEFNPEADVRFAFEPKSKRHKLVWCPAAALLFCHALSLCAPRRVAFQHRREIAIGCLKLARILI
jgi:hypothetical protein